METTQKKSTIEKTKSIDTWRFMQMKNFSSEEIQEHAPELLDENGEIDYELVIQSLFKALKETYRTANRARFARSSK